LHRYPSSDSFKDWLTKAGFGNIHFQVGERLQNRFVGQDVFPIPKDYTSQLSLLTGPEYDAGIKRIQETIDAAALKNEVVEFVVDISLLMMSASRM
jgi:hypothetical protein